MHELLRDNRHATVQVGRDPFWRRRDEERGGDGDGRRLRMKWNETLSVVQYGNHGMRGV